MVAIPETPVQQDANSVPPESSGSLKLFAVVSVFGVILVLLIACLARRQYEVTRPGAPPDDPEARRRQLDSIERIHATEAQRKELKEHQKLLEYLHDHAPLRSYGTFVTEEPKTLNDVCVTCLEKFAPTDKVRMLSCKHVHHSACLELWASWHHYACPTCRTPFKPGDAGPTESRTNNLNAYVPRTFAYVPL